VDDFKSLSQKILERLQDQLKQVRTGRAQPSLVEGFSVVVEAYGGVRMQLKELASITAADPTLLVIQPFDPSVLKDVERSLSQNDFGLSPVVHEQMIHIAIPPLTQERREQLVKVIHDRLEETRVAMRNLRTDVKKDIEAQKGAAGISEDDIKHQVDSLQKDVEAVMKQIDEIGAKKEQELRQL
jgi:ribosome recycling factor